MSASHRLLGIAFLLQGCSVTPTPTLCPAIDTSPAAIQQRVLAQGSVDDEFDAVACVSETGSKKYVYEEACLIGAANPPRKPAFAAGAWTRGTITFVPALVQRLAARESVVLATQFENQGMRVYADTNLIRAIVYKQFEACKQNS